MTAQRMLFLSIAATILTGIWLTGFGTAHWLLYVPVILLTFAGLTGVCPGLWLWKKTGLK
jgi:hypothetical protein